VALASAAMWGVIDVAAGSHYSNWVIPVWNSATRLGFFLVAAWLLHSLRRASRTVLALAHTDSLTGLANGRSFYNDLEREIRRQRRYGSAFTLAYVDLDHFKEVNDARGHAAGDELLRGVGTCIAAALRESDVVARLGGDEFGLLLPETGEESASLILERVLVTVAGTIDSAAPGVDGAGATVGAVVFKVAPESADAAVRAADEAMYEGKRVAHGGLQLRIWNA
jgi:diguanylate cyclase (GGDEF)-like protein